MLGLAATAGGNVALLAAGNSLLAAWWNGTRWTVSAPLAAGTVRALGFGADGSAWLLLGGGRAETIGGTGELVAGAAARAGRHRDARAAGHRDARAGNGRRVRRAGRLPGSKLTVWRLAQGAWAKVQQITVPIQYGSSG